MTVLRRHPIAVSLLVAVLLFLPSLQLPFMTDDFTHLVLIEDALGIRTAHPALAARYDALGLFNLFAFFDGEPAATRQGIEAGIFPWWTLPELKLNFWRPLTSELELLDYRLFGRHPLGYQLHNLAWYLGLVGVTGLLLRRAGGAAAVFAMLLYAMDDAHWLPAAWIANRNALIAATLGIAGLLAHQRWREAGWKPGLPLSVAGFALGLLGGETGLAVFAYLGCYELFAGPGNLRERLRALLSGGLVALSWAAWYKHQGLGTFGSEFYTDPVSQTREFLEAALTRFPILMAALLGGPPSHLGLILREAIPLQVAWGVGATLLCAALLKAVWPTLDAETRRALRWLVPGSVLSMLPVLATFPMDRLLLLPSIGGALVVAVVLRWSWIGLRERRWLRGAFGIGAGVLHLAVPVITWIGMPVFFGQQQPMLETLYTQAFPDPARTPQQDVLMVATSDILIGMYLPMWALYEDRPMPHAWQLISPARHSHRLTLRDRHTLELEVLEGGTDGSMLTELYRDRTHRMAPGDRVKSGPYTFEVLETGDQGIRRMAVSSRRPLEEVTVLAWQEGALHRLELPPEGETVLLPWSPGPNGM